jgi:hypothetical protein
MSDDEDREFYPVYCVRGFLKNTRFLGDLSWSECIAMAALDFYFQFGLRFPIWTQWVRIPSPAQCFLYFTAHTAQCCRQKTE